LHQKNFWWFLFLIRFVIVEIFEKMSKWNY